MLKIKCKKKVKLKCYSLKVKKTSGFYQRSQELRTFLIDKKVDIMLISETYFTERNHIRIPGFTVCDSKRLNGSTHDGTAVLLKYEIRFITRIQIYSPTEDRHFNRRSNSLSDRFCSLQSKASTNQTLNQIYGGR